MISSTPKEDTIEESRSPLNRGLIIKIIIVLVIILVPLVSFLVSGVANKNNKTNKNQGPIFYPEADYVEGQLIVKYKDSYTLDEINNIKDTLEREGLVSQKKVFDSEDPTLKHFYVLNFKNGTDVKKIADALSKLSEIEAVGPNYVSKIQVTPNDTFYKDGKQWDLVKIQMPEAWDINKGSNSIKVAVIDSGVDYNHPDLAGKIAAGGRDFTTCAKMVDVGNDRVKCTQQKSRSNNPMDDHGHGTHVAGTIGAATNNSRGIAGIDWNVSILPIKAMNKDGDGVPSDIAEAIRYSADQGAKIINLSIASPMPCNDTNMSLYQEAVSYAIARGAVVIAAAGNDGNTSRGDTANHTPPSCNGVIAVGNSDQNDKRAFDSDYGPRTDIAAPGVDIVSTIPGDKYAKLAGTSMAAPHVSGVAALLLSQNPSLSSSQVKDCLINNADPISTDKPIGKRLNAFKALNACSGQPKVTVTPTLPPTSATPVPAGQGSAATNPVGVISGSVFIDSNENKKFDSGERGFPDAVVLLEGPEAPVVRTDAGGLFSFDVAKRGSYRVNLLISGYPVGLTSFFSMFPGNNVNVPFPLPASFEQHLLANPNQGSGSQQKAPTKKPKVKTYSCREKTGAPASGAIQIGGLECTPNN